MDKRIRFEYVTRGKGNVLTRKDKSCGLKDIQIRVDRASFCKLLQARFLATNSLFFSYFHKSESVHAGFWRTSSVLKRSNVVYLDSCSVRTVGVLSSTNKTSLSVNESCC